MIHLRKVAILITVYSSATFGLGDTVVLSPDRDNTIFDHPTLDLSNGQGQFFFAGVTGVNNSFETRRSLIHFDLGSSIPSGSIVTSVTLRVAVAQSPNGTGPSDFTFHRLLSDWGEGTSDASGNEGSGTAATPGDATWDESFFGSQPWITAGGDFVTAASETHQMDGPGLYFLSGPGFVQDVQSWIDGSFQNYGWIILGDETSTRNVRKFVSSNGDPDLAPTLTIGFISIPEPSVSTMMGAGMFLIYMLWTMRNRTLQKE